MFFGVLGNSRVRIRGNEPNVVTVVEAGECFVQRSANRIGQICEGAGCGVVILGRESHCHSLYPNFPSSIKYPLVFFMILSMIP